MRRTNLPSLFGREVVAFGALALVVCAGCADGSSTTLSPSTGVGGGGGQSGAGGESGAGGGDASTTTGKGASTGSGEGGSGDGGSGQGGDTTSSAGGGGTGGSGEGGGAQCGVECPAGTYDIDNNPLTGDCGCEYTCDKTSDDDPIDGDFTDDNCDGSDGVVEACIYVSNLLPGDDSNPGTRAAPMLTIANAIARAVENGVPAVCVGSGTYEENVQVADGVSLYGGFDEGDVDFPFRRSEEVETTVTAQGTVFFVSTIEVDTHIEGFTIEADTPSGPGQSSYGVRFLNGNPNSSANLYVRYNNIETDDGNDGQNGVDGDDPVSNFAPSGVKGDDACECGGPRNGGPQQSCVEFGGRGGNGGHTAEGQEGFPGSGGALGGDPGPQAPDVGVTSCGDGGVGLEGDDGADGDAGDAGIGGQSIGTITGGLYVPSGGTAGTAGTNGRGGGGGGGGGGDRDDNCAVGICLCLANSTGGGGGSGGCGGVGGNFGTGGGGGGGSFAVFAVQGRIVVTDNTMNPGNGGDGGDGGNGAEAQRGGNGGPVSSASADGEGGPGGRGGAGGDGGVGGPGGGGAGGPSACLAYGPGVAQYTFEDNSCSPGARGNGGDGGINDLFAAPDGDNGLAQGLLQLDE